MAGHFVFNPEAAKPAIGRVKPNLLAQTAFPADRIAITDNQHPDHQFRIETH